MTTPLAKTYRCSRCGAERPFRELGGYDPITGDFSEAYCLCLVDCGSSEARELLDAILAELCDDQDKEGKRHDR